MPFTEEPNGGLFYGGDLGESPCKDELDHNFLTTSRLSFPNLKVLDRDVTDPSTLTPADGDMYIVAASAIGDWATHDNKIAVYDLASTAWVFYTPKGGWLCVVRDEAVLSHFNGTAWSAGITL